MITSIPGVTDIVARINELLPPEIRLWNFVRCIPLGEPSTSLVQRPCTDFLLFLLQQIRVQNSFNARTWITFSPASPVSVALTDFPAHAIAENTPISSPPTCSFLQNRAVAFMTRLTTIPPRFHPSLSPDFPPNQSRIHSGRLLTPRLHRTTTYAGSGNGGSSLNKWRRCAQRR